MDRVFCCISLCRYTIFVYQTGSIVVAMPCAGLYNIWEKDWFPAGEENTLRNGCGSYMLSYADIFKAKERLRPYIVRTPLLRVHALDAVLGCEVYLKPENLQRTGSFKIRGALNRILSLSEEEKSRGIVCCSSGNHAQGVACAASILGIDAKIVMPLNCNPVKLAGAKAFGSEVILAGTNSTERDAKADELVRTEGRILVHPYADDAVKAGQGTMGIEILEDAPAMDAVVVPIGGGGMISGIATAVKAARPDIRVIGAEPAGAPRYGLSRSKGTPQRLSSVDTIADGTRTDHADPGNFAIIEALVDELVTAQDSSIEDAMYLLLAKAKIVAEPSSSLGIAAVLEGTLSFEARQKVCFVISAGNNDLSLVKSILERKQ